MPSDTPETSEQRRIRRIGISLPVRVEGKTSSESGWNEMSHTSDVSSFGTAFTLTRRVEKGEVLKLTLPMPKKLRAYDFMEANYGVWCVVTSVKDDPQENGQFVVGTAFIGQSPPASYRQDPGLRFKVSFDPESESYQLTPYTGEETASQQVSRKHSRFNVPIDIVLEVRSQDGTPTFSEATVMENVSLGGAAIFSSLECEAGADVVVVCDRYSIELTAIVRGLRKGEDGIPRIHVEFTSGLFPLEGIDEML